MTLYLNLLEKISLVGARPRRIALSLMIFCYDCTLPGHKCSCVTVWMFLTIVNIAHRISVTERLQSSSSDGWCRDLVRSTPMRTRRLQISDREANSISTGTRTKLATFRKVCCRSLGISAIRHVS